MAAPQQVPDPFARSTPWTEQEWLELPEDERVDLVDGLLVMSPRGSNPHQRIAYRLFGVLESAAPAGSEVLGEPDLRLAVDRILHPDLAVGHAVDRSATITDATGIDLVVEVVSPGNAAVDRVLKPRLYAEAGIPWYLRIEQVGPVAHLHALRDDSCREVVRGEVVDLVEPFPVRIDLPHLAR